MKRVIHRNLGMSLVNIFHDLSVNILHCASRLVPGHYEEGRSCGGKDGPKESCGCPRSQHERRLGRRPIDPGPYIGERVTPIRKRGTYL